MNTLKSNRNWIIGIALVIIAGVVIYVYSPVKIQYDNYEAEQATRDTIQSLRNRIHASDDKYRLDLQQERQKLSDSANLEVRRREANANYYKSLYERSKTQHIDSVTARTHDFWNNWESPE